MLDKLTGVFVSFLPPNTTLHAHTDNDACVYGWTRDPLWRKMWATPDAVLYFVTPRLLGPPPVPTSWGSACPSSSSWGTGSSMRWPEMRSRRSACRGSSGLMARFALTSPTLLDLWVSRCDHVSKSVEITYLVSDSICQISTTCIEMCSHLRWWPNHGIDL